MRRVIIICAVYCFLSVGLAVETGAEVRVRTGLDGEYLTTMVVPGGPPWRQGVWGGRSRMGLRHGSTVLNPAGDRLGDLIPTVGEGSQAPHHPWVVWSRFNGSDYDLVYSSWTYAWSRILRVTPESLRGDDLDPSLAFSSAGQPLIAWWNRDVEDGHGTVYFSMFVETGWLEPLQISDDSIGGQHPSIGIEDGTIVIRYDSDDGSLRISYQFLLLDPTTITDDIDPQGSLTQTALDASKGVSTKN